jgi:hypothetical protein
LSIRKWYLTSICSVLECSMGFMATRMALMLSHMRETWVHSSRKSLSVYVIQQLGATNSHKNILGSCARLSYIRFFVRRPRNKWGIQKLARPRSPLSIDSTPRKLDIRKLK